MNTPKAPDPYATAAAQDASNLKSATATANLNRVDQSNPYGSTKWTQTGTNPDGTPKYSSDTQFSAPQQALFDAGNKNQLGALSTAQSFINGGQGAFSGKGPDLSYNATTAALDSLNHSRLDPQWQQNTDLQESKLANQGITPGTPAYDNAMRVFNQGKNDAYNSANLADYQTSANAALQQYNSPLQSYETLMGGTQPQNPTTGNPSVPQTNVAGTNVAGLVSDNYKNQLASNNAMMGGIFGTAGTIGGALLGGPLGAGAGGALGGALGGLFGGGGGNITYGGPNGPTAFS